MFGPNISLNKWDLTCGIFNIFMGGSADIGFELNSTCFNTMIDDRLLNVKSFNNI